MLVDHRDQVCASLRALGVQSRVYYPLPLHHQPAIAQETAAPVAEHLARCLLALPIHACLDETAVDEVLAALHEACP